MSIQPDLPPEQVYSIYAMSQDSWKRQLMGHQFQKADAAKKNHLKHCIGSSIPISYLQMIKFCYFNGLLSYYFYMHVNAYCSLGKILCLFYFYMVPVYTH